MIGPCGFVVSAGASASGGSGGGGAGGEYGVLLTAEVLVHST